MKLYKFRSLANFEFVLEIVLNERLYCAHFSDLNDPFEGIYLAVTHFPPVLLQTKGTERISSKNASSLYEQEKYCRICSLSADFEDVRLWSHYADGHKGIAIEIDFEGREVDIIPVRYLPELKKYGSTILATPFPEQVLTHKTTHWEYEKEFRILQSDKYYPVEGRITAIYLGPRVSKGHRVLLDKVVPSEIPIIATKINSTELIVEPEYLCK